MTVMCRTTKYKNCVDSKKDLFVSRNKAHCQCEQKPEGFFLLQKPTSGYFTLSNLVLVVAIDFDFDLYWS